VRNENEILEILTRAGTWQCAKGNRGRSERILQQARLS